MRLKLTCWDHSDPELWNSPLTEIADDEYDGDITDFQLDAPYTPLTDAADDPDDAPPEMALPAPALVREIITPAGLRDTLSRMTPPEMVAPAPAPAPALVREREIITIAGLQETTSPHMTPSETAMPAPAHNGKMIHPVKPWVKPSKRRMQHVNPEVAEAQRQAKIRKSQRHNKNKREVKASQPPQPPKDVSDVEDNPRPKKKQKINKKLDEHLEARVQIVGSSSMVLSEVRHSETAYVGIPHTTADSTTDITLSDLKLKKRFAVIPWHGG